MPQPIDTPTDREVLVVGRPEGGALDPETLQRAHGGLCWYDHGEEFRANPGDVVTMPVKVAAGYRKDGLVLTSEDAGLADALAESLPSDPESDG
jgi:hypothetical protein